MAKATCALCGASNPVTRVYLGMQSPRPNLIALACQECGKVSSQLRSLGEYVAFALVYSLVTLLLLLIGMHLFYPDVDMTWIAAVAAFLPFTVMPAWWANRQADRLAALAPVPDLPLKQKLLWVTVALGLIAATLGAGLFSYLYWIYK